MSEKFSRASLGKNFTGKKISSNIRGKLRENLGASSLDSGAAKSKLTQRLAGKNEMQRKQVYKELGLNAREKNNLEEIVTSGSTEGEGEDKELSPAQKRRNIFESRRSAQSSEKGEEFAGAARGSSSTKYEKSSAQFSGGEVGVSSLVGTLRNPKAGGAGFAGQKGSDSGSRSSGSGFANQGGGKRGGVDNSSSSSSSSGKKPLGF